MTKLNTSFAPDWASPPGDTILDMLEERGWTQAELARRVGHSEKHVSQLINGKVPLSEETAIRLERALGGSTSFWLSREEKFREQCARLKAQQDHESWVGWLDELPIKDLMDSDAIEKRRNDAKNKPSIVESCLRFFGVASPDAWRVQYAYEQLSFRRSRAEQSDMGAISSWLRLGELTARSRVCPPYDKARFEQALKIIRTLTCDSPAVFEPQMRKLLTEAGVDFVLVPSIPRAHVSGVARWLSPIRPMIQMSLYGKTNDKFWFTFFHEAAHILLHANNAKQKESVFLDDPNATRSDDPQEHEANEWAGNWLIPAHEVRYLSGLKTKPAVLMFARKLNIHPGIVVGRLQHDGLIDVTWMNKLKVSFALEKTAKST